MVDIIVIGGGPAGANFARIAGKKYSVLLLEKSNKSKANEKCCGGLLNEDSRLFLSEMKLSIPKEIMETPQTSILKAIDLDNDIVRDYRKDYLNISRVAFDQWLITKASENSKILLNAAFKGAKYNGDGSLQVKFLYKDKEYEETCKILVGADGAKSTVRREMFPYKIPENYYISIQTYYEKTEEIPYMGAVFYKELTNYYSWFIPKTDIIIVGGAYSPEDNFKQKEEVLKTLLHSRGVNFGKKKKRDGAFMIRPLSNKDLLPGSGNVVLIGEAAGLISPSSSEGISFALRSGYYLAEAIIERGIDYYNQYLNYFNKESHRIFSKKMKGKGLFDAGMRNIAMQSGILSIKPLGLL